MSLTSNSNALISNFLLSLGYFLLLILIVWPISSLITFFYILIQPLQSCNLLPRLMILLFNNFVTLPRHCALKIFHKKLSDYQFDIQNFIDQHKQREQSQQQQQQQQNQNQSIQIQQQPRRISSGTISQNQSSTSLSINKSNQST